MPIEVIGIEEIKARFDQLSDPKARLAIQRAGIRAACKVLLKAQQETVPFETGKLRDSLGIQIKRRGDKLFAMVGADKRWNFIGRFHEFGTKFMAGTHWMQKAFDSSSKEALSAYEDAVRALFEKREWNAFMAVLALSESSGEGEE